MNIILKLAVQKNNRKKKGYIMIQTVLALILLSAVSVGFFQIYSGQFAALASARAGSQAQQAADLVVEYLKMSDYDSLSSSKSGTVGSLIGSGLTDTTLRNYYYQWSIAGEKSFTSGDNSAKLKIATVSIKKSSSDTGARATVTVPLSSAGSGASEGGGDDLPVGTILPYQGSDSDIPEKWHLCDGNAGTPDLRDGRFLEGSSTAKNWHSAGLPNVTATFGYLKDGFVYRDTVSGAINGTSHTRSRIPHTQDGTASNYYRSLTIDLKLGSSIYKDDCNTVQPKSYTVKFIMKIKA